MGSFDGPPYLSKFATTEQEMYEGTLGLSSAGKIDNIDNLKNDQVYIFQGLLDSIVPWGQFKLEAYQCKITTFPCFRRGIKNVEFISEVCIIREY